MTFPGLRTDRESGDLIDRFTGIDQKSQTPQMDNS